MEIKKEWMAWQQNHIHGIFLMGKSFLTQVKGLYGWLGGECRAAPDELRGWFEDEDNNRFKNRKQPQNMNS